MDANGLLSVLALLLAGYSSMYFFPKLAAFNLGWHERPEKRIDSYVSVIDKNGRVVPAAKNPLSFKIHFAFL